MSNNSTEKNMIWRSFLPKHIQVLSFLLLLFLPSFTMAFNDGSPNFEMIVTDSQGSKLAMAEIQLLVEITTGKLDGNTQYAENHKLITNDLGVARIPVGYGTPTKSEYVFDNFDISQGKNYIRIFILEAGGPRLLLNSQLANVAQVQKWLFADSKINTVIAIMIIVWLGILVYLLLTSRKVKALEKQLQELKQRGGQNS